MGNFSGSYSYALSNGSNPISDTATNSAFSRSLAAGGLGAQTFTLTVSSDGQITTANTSVTVNAPPALSISPSSATLSCTTSSVSLSAVGTGTYRWSTGASTSSISATATGTYSVTLTSANGCSATTSAVVGYQNCAPTVATAIPAQSATVGQVFNYTIPAITFTDAETPGSLTLSVLGLPSGLSFVAPAMITGSVSASASSFYSVTVTATDPAGGSVSTILPLSVVNPGGCGSMFTLKAGDWNDPATWSCGRIPVSTDAVTLNHAVSLPATYQGQALKVIYSAGGRLLFGTGSRLRLGGN